MNDTLTCVPLRKSTRSGNTNCVLAGACDCHGGTFGDTKDPHGPALTVSVAAYRAFIAGLTGGALRA